MKNFYDLRINLGIILLTLLFLNTSFAQSGLEYQIIRFPATKDFFVKWNILPDLPVVKIKIDGVLYTERDYSNNSFLLKNISAEYIPELEIQYLNLEETEGLTYTLPLGDKQPGVVHVTEAMYDIVHPWTDTESNLLDALANQESISDPEIYSVLQQFFEISPDVMNSLIGGSSGLYPPFNPSLTVWTPVLDALIGSGTYYGECNCKLFQTNSNAQNRPNAANIGDAETCTHANPVDVGDNFEFNGGDDDNDELVWSSQLGAGKGFLYFIQADGADDIGTESNPNTHSLPVAPFSRIRYKLVCADPITIKPAETCRCTKVVDIEWEYASRYHWSVDDGWNILGSDNSIYLEDWAVASLSAPSGSEILGRTLVSKRGACDSPPLTSTFTDLAEVATSVSAAIGDPNIQSIITAAGNTIDFFGAISSSIECNSSNDSTALLLQGHREDIVLGPGEQIILSITTGSVLGGHIRNNGKASARIVSEGYVAGVLWSTDGIQSEGCCQNEKIGSYALSSLSDFDFSRVTDIHKPHRSTIDPLDGTVFQQGPLGGFSGVATTVGAFLGQNGPWGGVFDPTGCCDDVVVDCFSKCGIYRDCGGASDDYERIQSNGNVISTVIKNPILPIQLEHDSLVLGKNSLNEMIQIETAERAVFPNPVLEHTLNITLLEEEQINETLLYDVSGKIYKVVNWEAQDNILTLEIPAEMPPGLVIILMKTDKGAVFSRVIKN